MYFIKKKYNSTEIYYAGKMVAAINKDLKVDFFEPAFEKEKDFHNIVSAQLNLLKDKNDKINYPVSIMLTSLLDNTCFKQDITGIIKFKEKHVFKDFRLFPTEIVMKKKKDYFNTGLSIEEYRLLLEDASSYFYKEAIDTHKIKAVYINQMECQNENGFPLSYEQIQKLDEDLKYRVKIDVEIV